MSESIGKAAVRIAIRYLRRRYRREIRIGVGLAAVVVGIGVAFASRNVREG
jgi:uncharacterized protein involved in exopolysaccharide biosynthesis